MDRRNFLKLGLASSIALSGIGLTATLTGCSGSVPASSEWKVLREQDRIFLRSIAPAMLHGALPADDLARTQGIENMLRYMDLAIHNLGPHNEKQMTDLFMLVDMRVTRGLATGVWSKWQDASEADIDQFLNRWRNSSISLLRLAYNGLNKLMAATWYGQPAAWSSAHYPGPPHANILITPQITQQSQP